MEVENLKQQLAACSQKLRDQESNHQNASDSAAENHAAELASLESRYEADTLAAKQRHDAEIKSLKASLDACESEKAASKAQNDRDSEEDKKKWLKEYDILKRASEGEKAGLVAQIDSLKIDLQRARVPLGEATSDERLRAELEELRSMKLEFVELENDYDVKCDELQKVTDELNQKTEEFDQAMKIADVQMMNQKNTALHVEELEDANAELQAKNAELEQKLNDIHAAQPARRRIRSTPSRTPERKQSRTPERKIIHAHSSTLSPKAASSVQLDRSPIYVMSPKRSRSPTQSERDEQAAEQSASQQKETFGPFGQLPSIEKEKLHAEISDLRRKVAELTVNSKLPSFDNIDNIAPEDFPMALAKLQADNQELILKLDQEMWSLDFPKFRMEADLTFGLQVLVE